MLIQDRGKGAIGGGLPSEAESCSSGEAESHQGSEPFVAGVQGLLPINAHSHQANAKTKAKISFDVWIFFFDLFHFRVRFHLV